RGRAVQVRLVAVRGHHLPLAHRLDLGQRPAGVERPRAGRRPRRPPPGVRALMRPVLGAARRALLAALLLLALPAPARDDTRVVFPASVPQGAMVIGKVPPDSRVEYAGRVLRTTGYGTVVFGIGRDEAGPVEVAVVRPDGVRSVERIAVSPRDWPVQRVDGVPPKTVDPPPAIAERIAREQA